MDQETPALKFLRTTLVEIRTKADQALEQLEQPVDVRAAKWRCATCGHTKHFTRAVPSITAAPCPKCDGKSFEVLLR